MREDSERERERERAEKQWEGGFKEVEMTERRDYMGGDYIWGGEYPAVGTAVTS